MRLTTPRRSSISAGIAAFAISALAACGSSSTGHTSKSTTTANGPSATSAATPTTSVALQPIQSDSELEYYIAHVNQLLERSCFDIYQAFDAQCTVDAGYSERWLQQLLSRLTNEYPKTRVATQTTINELDHWWQWCASTAPNTQERRDCIPYIPRRGQTISIQAAWYGERQGR
jgi:hypothetical protein